MKILGIGLSGLVGSRIVALLGSTHEFSAISTSSGVDITQKQQVHDAITSSNASVVLHLAAKTDVNGCEEDKQKDLTIQTLPQEQQEIQWMQHKTAWAVNVVGTENVVHACEASGKKLIAISTDFVFDGTISEDDAYTEESVPHPLNWYGQTKYMAEQMVEKATIPWVILRIAYPYRSQFTKNDFVRAVLGRLQKAEGVTMVTDHVMSPTFIDDIAFALDQVMKQEATGMFHCVGSQWITPYDAAVAIAKTFHIDVSLIEKTTRAEYFASKAQRPFRLQLKNDKIRGLGVSMVSFEEGLHKIKSQLHP